MRFSVLTLGCDKNTVDSERYIAELVAHGAERAASMDDADVVVVNTCGFIVAAEREAKSALRGIWQWQFDVPEDYRNRSRNFESGLGGVFKDE